MKKNSWRIKLLLWVASRIAKVPIIVNFTPPEMENVYAIGLAYSQPAADRMAGDVNLIQRLKQAEALASSLSTTRSGRRQMNKIIKAAGVKKK